MKLELILSSNNLAEELDDEELKKIGSKVVDGYEVDLDSRKPWEDDIDKWTELALQISKTKTFPWPNASNVKFPLLATAAMQFAARAYPSLVPSNGQVVKSQVIGYDQTGEKHARAERVNKYMSYQLLHEMDEWEDTIVQILDTPRFGSIRSCKNCGYEQARTVAGAAMEDGLARPCRNALEPAPVTVRLTNIQISAIILV
jgi:chaperonin GroES